MKLPCDSVTINEMPWAPKSTGLRSAALCCGAGEGSQLRSTTSAKPAETKGVYGHQMSRDSELGLVSTIDHAMHKTYFMTHVCQKLPSSKSLAAPQGKCGPVTSNLPIHPNIQQVRPIVFQNLTSLLRAFAHVKFLFEGYAVVAIRVLPGVFAKLDALHLPDGFVKCSSGRACHFFQLAPHFEVEIEL